MLLPILKPELIGSPTSSLKHYPAKPELFVVLSGASPSVTAYVMYGYASTPKKVKLFFSEASANKMSALKKLLGVTMTLVQTHIFDNNKNAEEGHAVKVVGGGYMASEQKLSPPSVDDAKFWNSSAEPSPTISFQSKASSSDDVIQTGGRSGASTVMNNGKGYAQGLGLKGSFLKAYGFQHNGSYHSNGTGGNGNTSKNDVPRNDNFYGTDPRVCASFNGSSSSQRKSSFCVAPKSMNKSFDGSVKTNGWA